MKLCLPANYILIAIAVMAWQKTIAEDQCPSLETREMFGTSLAPAFDKIIASVPCARDQEPRNEVNFHVTEVDDPQQPVKISMTPPGVVEPVIEMNILKFHYALTYQDIPAGVEIVVPKGLVKMVLVESGFGRVGMSLLDETSVQVTGGKRQVSVTTDQPVTLSVTGGKSMVHVNAPRGMSSLNIAGGHNEIQVLGDVASGLITGGWNSILVQGSLKLKKMVHGDNEIRVSGGGNCDEVKSDSSLTECTTTEETVTELDVECTITAMACHIDEGVDAASTTSGSSFLSTPMALSLGGIFLLAAGKL